jgi:hypothetical protein
MVSMWRILESSLKSRGHAAKLGSPIREWKTVHVTLLVVASAVACGSPAAGGASFLDDGPATSDDPPLPGGQSGTDSMDTPPDLRGVVCDAESFEEVPLEGELAEFGVSPEQLYAAVEGERALFPEICSEAPTLALRVTRRPLAFVAEGSAEGAELCRELVLGVDAHAMASDRSIEHRGSLLSFVHTSREIIVPLGAESRAWLSFQFDEPERIELRVWSDGRFVPREVFSTRDPCQPVED